jgi:aspartyl-tRNA(Asn)/glutamyl-tRNA(Gln) amidotransferase subunit B
MKYADVSDVDLYHGNMRFDVNVSVASKDSKDLGLRAEVKNLNSFKSVEKAAEYEINRQIELLEKNEKVIQETRGWDDDKMKTFSQRGKEDAHDYRYFPDPDLPPIDIDDDYIDSIRKSMPALPTAIRESLTKVGLDGSQISTILSNMEFSNIILLAIEEGVSSAHIKRLVNWLTVDVKALINDSDSELNLTFSQLIQLSEMVDDGKLNSTAAKQVITHMLNESGEPDEIANKLNLIQMSDDNELRTIVEKIVSENVKAAEDVKKGEEKVIGFLVGQVMKETNGQANPQMVKNLIKSILKAEK